jgi:hypothetical protein
LETLQDAYESALRSAALEAFEGIYNFEELAKMIKEDDILTMAMNLILDRQSES